jgi:IS1 family transposase
MNKLSIERQAAVIRALCEGNSIAATCRMVGAAKGTVLTLLRNVGAHCKNHHDRTVLNVPTKRIQLDELWAFVGMKKKRATDQQKAQGYGDVWTFYALDQDSKLVVSYRVGSRSIDDTMAFCQDLADRLANRVQVTSDGMKFYRPAMEAAFGWWGADFAQLHKIYAMDWEAEKGRYTPPTCIGAEKHVYMGEPKEEDISTSHVERMNLTTRMQVRRFTRLTNAHSKKLANHLYAVALHVMWVNFCRPSQALSKGRNKVTPAMFAGLADRVWTAEDILNLME